WVQTVEDVEQAIRDGRYPPEGRRGIGGERATAWGQCIAEHTAEANAHLLVVPLIESVATIPNVSEMCQVDGTDVFFFGPADFSATAGHRGQWEGPGVAQKILQLKDTILAAGKHCGLLTTGPENIIARREQGFRMLGLGADGGLLLRAIHQMLQVVDRDRTLATSLDPVDGRAIQLPLSRPPASATPDRGEVIITLDTAATIELQTGVALQPLVGSFNTARNLTTGIVTMQPAALLNYHTHPCSESITVLEGEAEISVEGRTYRLSPLDNITIPRWLPHQARNPNLNIATRLHVALAMSVPERELVTREFELTQMPIDFTGKAGFERVTRFALAERLRGVGPGAEFVDYFNSALMPGIEMSGGFARFDPQGRLPDHYHDFDESICIIRGDATCHVEGNRYSLNNCATAMVPRGRVHYFINDSAKPMDMIWVYAGAMPERILISPSFVRG
ncbi:MAG: aldolase/citrate lyase family protein, partial [Aureliella sp.]